MEPWKLSFIYGFSLCWQNYTGDRLNFGLAAEQAKSEGYKVDVCFHLDFSISIETLKCLVGSDKLLWNCVFTLQIVIVGDDCGLPPPRGIAGRRGLAGTILVNKVPSFSSQICIHKCRFVPHSTTHTKAFFFHN